MAHRIECAITTWDGRATATYFPLRSLIPYANTKGGIDSILVDSYGRQLGSPNFGDARPICLDEIFVEEDYRYYCFTAGSGLIIVYKETGYSLARQIPTGHFTV